MSPFNGAYSAVKSMTPLIHRYHNNYSAYTLIMLCIIFIHVDALSAKIEIAVEFW